MGGGGAVLALASTDVYISKGNVDQLQSGSSVCDGNGVVSASRLRCELNTPTSCCDEKEVIITTYK